MTSTPKITEIELKSSHSNQQLYLLHFHIKPFSSIQRTVSWLTSIRCTDYCNSRAIGINCLLTVGVKVNSLLVDVRCSAVFLDGYEAGTFTQITFNYNTHNTNTPVTSAGYSQQVAVSLVLSELVSIKLCYTGPSYYLDGRLFLDR